MCTSIELTNNIVRVGTNLSASASICHTRHARHAHYTRSILDDGLCLSGVTCRRRRWMPVTFFHTSCLFVSYTFVLCLAVWCSGVLCVFFCKRVYCIELLGTVMVRDVQIYISNRAHYRVVEIKCKTTLEVSSCRLQGRRAVCSEGVCLCPLPWCTNIITMEYLSTVCSDGRLVSVPASPNMSQWDNFPLYIQKIF